MIWILFVFPSGFNTYYNLKKVSPNLTKPKLNQNVCKYTFLQVPILNNNNITKDYCVFLLLFKIKMKKKKKKISSF